MIRIFNKDTDYSIVESWWKDHKQDPAPIDFLSDYGVISFEDEKPICAIWFFPILTAKFGLIMAPVTNPNTTKEERNTSLNSSLDILHMMAKDLGYSNVLCLSNVDAFEKRLKSFGYTEGDKNCTHYWGGL